MRTRTATSYNSWRMSLVRRTRQQTTAAAAAAAARCSECDSCIHSVYVCTETMQMRAWQRRSSHSYKWAMASASPGSPGSPVRAKQTKYPQPENNTQHHVIPQGKLPGEGTLVSCLNLSVWQRRCLRRARLSRACCAPWCASGARSLRGALTRVRDRTLRSSWRGGAGVRTSAGAAGRCILTHLPLCQRAGRCCQGRRRAGRRYRRFGRRCRRKQRRRKCKMT